MCAQANTGTLLDRILESRRAEVQLRKKVLPETALKRSEEHTSELQSRLHLVCRLLLEKKKKTKIRFNPLFQSRRSRDHPSSCFCVCRASLSVRNPVSPAAVPRSGDAVREVDLLACEPH